MKPRKQQQQSPQPPPPPWDYTRPLMDAPVHTIKESDIRIQVRSGPLGYLYTGIKTGRGFHTKRKLIRVSNEREMALYQAQELAEVIQSSLPPPPPPPPPAPPPDDPRVNAWVESWYRDPGL